MSLNDEKVKHDNDSYCFVNHNCINCAYEKIDYDKDPCIVCIGTSKHNRLCKWEHE